MNLMLGCPRNKKKSLQEAILRLPAHRWRLPVPGETGENDKKAKKGGPPDQQELNLGLLKIFHLQVWRSLFEINRGLLTSL